MRATDDIVRSVLTWAKNYEEIESFKMISPRGRKWQIKLAAPKLVGSGLMIDARSAVPAEMIMTSREALAFAYGCAAGGIHDRAEFASEHWGWERSHA